jgi:hypothetical protein
MTLYLNCRAQPVAGGVIYPYPLKGDPIDRTKVTVMSDVELKGLLAGKQVLFAVHGFNVNQRDAVSDFAALDDQLKLGPSAVLVGVLWPGDAWIPVINYPFEGGDAMHSGANLADYCNRQLGGALSLSFMSHSLGARVVLQAVAQLKRKARLVCLTAGAINRDCLETEYASAAKNAQSIGVLASHKDWVLSRAFPLGDPISNILHDDHRFFEKALGNDGPASPDVPPLIGPYQIPDEYDYLHSSYLPPKDLARWTLVAGYVRQAFFGQPLSQDVPFPPPPP